MLIHRRLIANVVFPASNVDWADGAADVKLVAGRTGDFVNYIFTIANSAVVNGTILESALCNGRVISTSSILLSAQSARSFSLF